MDELVTCHSEEMEKMCDDKDACSNELPLSDDEASDCDLSNFKTPLQYPSVFKSHHVRADHTNVFDSGFSSAQHGRLSSAGSSLDSGVCISPQQGPAQGSRRVTLGICDFSPVTRESCSLIRSRKLDFNSSEPCLVASQRKLGDADVESQENLSEDAESQELKESMEDMSIRSTSLSPVSPGLFSFERKALSHRVAKLAHEDLETSLQDMSLEESGSSSSSMSFSSTSRPISPSPLTKESTSEQMKSEAVTSSSTDIEKAAEKLVKGVEVHVSNVSKLLSPSEEKLKSDFSISSNTSCKDSFMTALHLTSAHISNTDVTALSTPQVLPSSSCSPQFGQQSSCTETASHRPQVFPSESIASFNSILPTGYQNSHASLQLAKSPCKRGGTDQIDSDCLFSPTKSRKTERPERLTPKKRAAARNIFVIRGKSSEGRSPTFVSLHSQQAIPGLKQADSTSNDSLSIRFPTSPCSASHDCAMPCPTVLTLTASHVFHRMQTLFPGDPSRLIGRNIGVAKLDIIGALHPQFILCIAKIMACLDSVDLQSVFSVSRAWRQALESDTTSYSRYKLYRCERPKSRTALASLGKENDMGKSVDDRVSTPMTESRGCLANVQVQAHARLPQPLQEKAESPAELRASLLWGDELRHCPACLHPALVRPHQGRAVCTQSTCGYDFCTSCFAAFHHPKPCKALNCALSKKDVAGSHKSKKSLKRL